MTHRPGTEHIFSRVGCDGQARGRTKKQQRNKPLEQSTTARLKRLKHPAQRPGKINQPNLPSYRPNQSIGATNDYRLIRSTKRRVSSPIAELTAITHRRTNQPPPTHPLYNQPTAPAQTVPVQRQARQAERRDAHIIHCCGLDLWHLTRNPLRAVRTLRRQNTRN